ncbi:MAG: LPS export ABC transporter permease LptG [Pseudomonadota bacterium]
MIGRLNQYLIGASAKALLPVMLMLLALFSFLALADELEDVGEGTYAAMDAVTVVGLTLPNRLLDLLPVMLLLGVLVGLGGLAGSSELTAARAAGRSPWQIIRPVLAFGLVVGLLLLAAAEYVVPAAERKAGQLRAKAIEDLSVASDATWTRAGDQIIKIGGIGEDGELTDVEVYRFDGAELAELREAPAAEVIDARYWLLDDVNGLSWSAAAAANVAGTPAGVEDGLRERGETRALWPVDLPANKLAALAVPPESLSLGDLRARVLRSQANGLDAHGLRVMLWQRLALPLAALAMVALALPFVLGSTRVMSAGERITYGILAGVVFYLIEQACAHFAIIYHLNPVLMATLPEALILLFVGRWLWRLA